MTASIKVGIHQALREVASHGRGVVVVTGSLHAAAEGLRSLPGIAPVPVAKACGHSHH